MNGAAGTLMTCLAVIAVRGIHPVAAATPAPQPAAAAASLVVEGARAIASLPGSGSTVIYVTIRNDGAQADRLVSAATPAAAMVHLHAGSMQGGVSSMRPADGFDVPAHGRLQLRVGGDHLMLMSLPRPLAAGTSLQLTLHFARAGDLKVSVPVVAPTGN